MREALLDAAFDLLVAEGPTLPASGIARRAGASKALVYHHFGDREGLLDAMAGRVLAQTQQGLSRLAADYPNPRDRLAALARTLLSAPAQPPPLEARRVMLFWMEGEPPRAALRDGLLADFVAATAREGVATGAMRAGLDAAALATRILARWHGLTALHAAGRAVEFDAEADALADELTAAVARK
ncbi:MAG: Bacterial regulatory protein tetR family [Thermoplasmata archaeon]|jgi:AcrR family transcriptional regulator|nr:Bacterial regulatory protein tetR family [Thermoplasmata archaeon]